MSLATFRDRIFCQESSFSSCLVLVSEIQLICRISKVDYVGAVPKSDKAKQQHEREYFSSPAIILKGFRLDSGMQICLCVTVSIIFLLPRTPLLESSLSSFLFLEPYVVSIIEHSIPPPPSD